MTVFPTACAFTRSDVRVFVLVCDVHVAVVLGQVLILRGMGPHGAGGNLSWGSAVYSVNAGAGAVQACWVGFQSGIGLYVGHMFISGSCIVCTVAGWFLGHPNDR